MRGWVAIVSFLYRYWFVPVRDDDAVLVAGDASRKCVRMGYCCWLVWFLDCVM